MIGSLIQIIIGIVIAFIVPEWVKFGDKKSRSTVKLIVNIIGIIIIVIGGINLVTSLA